MTEKSDLLDRKRILFIPLSGGFGHLNRCNALAKKIQKIDPLIDIRFAVGGITHEFALKVDLPVIKIPYAASKKVLEDWFRSSTDKDSVRTPLIHSLILFTTYIIKGFYSGLKIFLFAKRFKPDIIVSDGEYWSIFFSLINRTPCVYISNDVMPRSSSLLGNKTQLSQSFIDALINIFMKWTEIIIVPDNLKHTRINAELKKKSFFVGPMLNNETKDLPNKYSIRQKLGFNQKDILVLATVTGIGVDPERVYKIIEVFKKLKKIESNLKMIIKYWPAMSDEEAKKLEYVEGLILSGFIPNMLDYMVASDILIAHGGHTSLMEAALAGLATIVIPLDRHEEQVYNAKRMASEGRVIMISPTEFSEKTLTYTILSLIKNEKERRKMIVLNRKMLDKEGALKAANIILDTFRNRN